MEEKLLEINNISVIYKSRENNVEALNNVSLQVNKGETLGLVGETGAGKTTLALAILRLLPERTGFITNGNVVFDGTNLNELSEKDMRSIRGEKISMIFQDPMTALNPILTVGEQIEEALSFHNHGKLTNEQIQEKVEQLLKMVGIEPSRKKDYPHQFSGGMKQRVVIAMALACEPSLVIADEPTTALDVTIQAQVLKMMKDLQRRLGTSMILITHDLGIVAQTCEKVAVMYAGEIIEYGTLRDVFLGEKHHPYTIGLFGAIPDLEKKTHRLNPISGLMPDPTNLPKGCKFAPRCPNCMDVCKSEPSVYVEGTHQIRCHLYEGEK